MRTIFAILLFCLPVLGQVAVTVGPGKSQRAAIRKPSYHNHPATPLLFEDFENPTGYDLAGWGENVQGTGSIDEDYTATVLYGTQSLLLNKDTDNATYTTNSFAANGHVWVAFRFRLTATANATDSEIFSLTDASDACQVKVTVNNDGDLKVWPQCGTAYQTGFGLAINTTYTIWVEYNKDNGASSYASIGYSTGSVRPTSGDTFVDGTATSSVVNVSRIRIGDSSGGHEADFIIDHVLIDDVQIESYP